MSEIALYYPYVHPREESWVKQALLFWPRIQRIVPADYPVTDTPTLRLLVDEGILTERLPDPGAAELSESFVEFLTRHATSLQGAYSVEKATVLPPRPGWNDAELDPRLGWIHTSKLDENAVEHLDRLRRSGAPTGPEDYLVPNLHGGRLSRQRVGQIVGKAAKLASKRLVSRGLPPLPHTTPHSLRRTYVSIALLANNFDVKWVMGQVGHADSKMTLDVYAQLEQRVDRRHGTSFDTLVRRARRQAASLTIGTDDAAIGRRLGDEAENRPSRAPHDAAETDAEPADVQGLSWMARAGIEPATPRFSVVC
jgi:hypothetical protein